MFLFSFLLSSLSSLILFLRLSLKLSPSLHPSLPLFFPFSFHPSVSFPPVDASFFSSFERSLAFALFDIKC